jgi:FkbM family methyltransferase
MSSFAYKSWLLSLKVKIRVKKELSEEDSIILSVLAPYIKSGSTVIDIGANIGLFTGRFRELVGDHGRVLAFEPIPANFQTLKSLWGKYPNIELYDCALSDKSDEVEFLLPKSRFKYLTAAVVSTADQLQNNHSIRCDRLILPTKKLDNLVSDINISNLDLIKCDVEGHELQVMRGAVNLIKRFNPIIQLEILREKWTKGNPLNSGVGQLMKSFGYQIMQIKGNIIVGLEEFDPIFEDFLLIPRDRY